MLVSRRTVICVVKGVPALLDGVNDFLPSPADVTNVALDIGNQEKEVQLKCDPTLPLVALAFKLEESRFGQLTYLRVYQGAFLCGCVKGERG